MKKFFQDFKAFALKGNIIDMAVGVVIGGAFGKIVTSLVTDTDTPSDPIVCGDPEELMATALPAYVGGTLWCTVCESVASESGARRTAMNAANKNAEEMIDSLKLTYNRARQAVITQEITEIVSGAEAL